MGLRWWHWIFIALVIAQIFGTLFVKDTRPKMNPKHPPGPPMRCHDPQVTPELDLL
jgi:hypothetical protein